MSHGPDGPHGALVRFDPAWTDGITRAYARFLASVLALRPNLFVRQGNLISWVDEDPDAMLPPSSASAPRCRSCGRQASSPRRVLCARCQRCGPVVFEGAQLATTMYRSCHPDYDLDDAKKESIRVLLDQISAAKDVEQQADYLCRVSWNAFQKAENDPAVPPSNVVLNARFVGMCDLYDRQRSCGDSAMPVVIGGLGIKLRSRVNDLAAEWIGNVDVLVRQWFDLPLDGDDDQQRMVQSYFGRFADIISNHATLLEPDVAPSDEKLCIHGFEHIAESFFKFDHQWARHRIQLDVLAMARLKQLALEGLSLEELLEHRAELLRILRSPPPELLVTMPTLANDFGFELLRDAIGVLDDPRERIAGMDGIAVWRKEAKVEALGMLVDMATRNACGWEMPKSGFLDVLRQAPQTMDSEATGVQLRQHPDSVLPPLPWVQGTGRWQLRKPEVLRHRRVGLRSVHLRVVILCSIVVRLLGSEAPVVFVPGRMASGVLCLLTQSFLGPARRAVQELQEVLEPLTRGVEFGIAVRQLNQWRGSHLEDDVRAAARHLSQYSLQEIEAVFGTRSGFWSVGYNGTRLLEHVENNLMLRRDGGCLPIVAEALSIALELFGQYRTQMLRWSPTARASRAGDLLRLLPTVHDWIVAGGASSGRSGAIRISLPEAAAAHDGVRQVLEHLKNRGFVARKRVGTVCVWSIEPEQLAALLAPR